MDLGPLRPILSALTQIHKLSQGVSYPLYNSLGVRYRLSAYNLMSQERRDLQWVTSMSLKGKPVQVIIPGPA